MKKKLLRGLIAAIVTVALVLLGGEVFLRFTGYRDEAIAATANRSLHRWVELSTCGFFERVEDPDRRYAMRPGAVCTVDDWTFRASSHRTRGPDFPAAKPPGEKRLLMLGDSFCFGMWCDEEETVVARLAQAATEREAELGTGITWRPVNLGVPGYHSGQQLASLLEDGLALEPDVVVLYFNTNDIEREGFFLDEERGALFRDPLPLSAATKRRLWGSHLYGWAASRLARRRESGSARPELDPRVSYAYVRDDNQAATRASITRLAEVCRERGLPLFFVHQPHMGWQGDLRSPAWPMLPLVKWAEDLRTELAIPGVCLLGLFRGYRDNVDRLAQGAPMDVLMDPLIADERMQRFVESVRALARERGQELDSLPVIQQAALFSSRAADVPADIDFHLNAKAYGLIANVVYASMREQGLLP